jgi:hypothetical protein
MDTIDKRFPPSLVTAAALLSLQQALASVYWYKRDLRSFLEHTLTDRSLLPLLDWKDNKRSIVATLVRLLAGDADRYGQDLRRLMLEVARVDDFRHLLLDGGDEKARQARDAVAALRGVLGITAGGSEREELDDGAGKRSRADASRAGVTERLVLLRSDFSRLLASGEEASRGRGLKLLAKGLFAAFDVEAGVLNLDDERIEGSIRLDDAACLFEARWQDKPAGLPDILKLGERIRREVEETLGLYLSLNGFSQEATRALWDRRPVVLMDGADLMAVLEQRIDLVRLLLRKKQHALQTGGIFLPVIRILTAGE